MLRLRNANDRRNGTRVMHLGARRQRLPGAVQLELAEIFDQVEELLLEFVSLACAPTTPRRQSKRMRGHEVDSLTLRAAPASDVQSVGQKPHLV
jgi:hypothetical protein